MSKRTRKSRNQLGPNANIPKMNHLTYSSSPHAGRGMKNHAKTTRAIVQIIKIHRRRLLLVINGEAFRREQVYLMTLMTESARRITSLKVEEACQGFVLGVVAVLAGAERPLCFMRASARMRPSRRASV